MSHTKGRLNTKLPRAVDSHGMSARLFITAGSGVDCTQAGQLIESISNCRPSRIEGRSLSRVVAKHLRKLPMQL
jgi:hypothetical protein